jgi:hypothetical protein
MAAKKPGRTPVAELPFSQRTKRGLYEENVHQRDVIGALSRDLQDVQRRWHEEQRLRAKIEAEAAPTEDQTAEDAHLVGLLRAIQFAARLDTALDLPEPNDRSTIITHATHAITYLCALAYSHAAPRAAEAEGES